jgi:hypothetical protein
MMKSIKRLVLTGAAVMVMMSFAAPAMAADLTDLIDPSAVYTNYGSSFDPSVYEGLFNPDIGTAGDQIPPEAGGPTPPSTGPVVVGPAPGHVNCWEWVDEQWSGYYHIPGYWKYIC